jgi:hypothetical protein
VENATTIEEAVSLITEPTEAPQAEAAEAVEVEEAEVIEEPTEAEEPTQEFESDDDDVDLDEIDLDYIEEEPQHQLISVKADGKEEQVTLDELKQGYAGQKYVQRTMQENAQEKKRLEQREQQLEQQYRAQTQQLAQQQQQFLQLRQQAQQIGMQPPEAPSKELFDRDPIGYMEAKIQYDEAAAQYNQHVHQLQQLQQQQSMQEEQERQAFLQEQAQILQQYIPEIADPEKGDKIKSELVQTGVHYGFTEQEIQDVSDARYVRALNDAMKWRRLQNKKLAAAKGEPQKTVVKAGAKRRAGDGEAAARKKQQQKLRKSGRIEDALGLMLKP